MATSFPGPFIRRPAAHSVDEASKFCAGTESAALKSSPLRTKVGRLRLPRYCGLFSLISGAECLQISERFSIAFKPQPHERFLALAGDATQLLKTPAKNCSCGRGLVRNEPGNKQLKIDNVNVISHYFSRLPVAVHPLYGTKTCFAFDVYLK